MRFSSGFVLRVAVPAAIVLVSCAAAPAQTVEPPPSFNAAQIAGITRVGPNYTVVSPVPSDGLLRVYTLNTPYGEFTARGDAMLRMRTRELVALSQLEQVSTSKSFTAALAQAGLNPLKYAGSLIRDPLKTVSDTFAGVGAMFGRIKSGFDNAGQTPDNAMASLLGVTSEKRQLAAAYGVDLSYEY